MGPYYILTVVSVGHLLVGILLKEFITKSGFSELNLTILCLGTTINDGGKSDRSVFCILGLFFVLFKDR